MYRSVISTPVNSKDAEYIKRLCENLIAEVTQYQDKNQGKDVSELAKQSVDDLLDLIIDVKVDCVAFMNNEENI